MKKSLLALLLAATSIFSHAAEQVLDFTLVTKRIEGTVQEPKNVEGQNVGLIKAFGVASFANGKTAVKEFVHGWDFNKGTGPFFGYSTYTFEDGSAITVKYTGNMAPGKPMRGDYTILSGTGAYAGATGTGYFQAAAHKFSDGAFYTGQLTVRTR